MKETVAKQYAYRGKLPGICTKKGIILRKKAKIEHFASRLHVESIKAYKIKQLAKIQRSTTTPMGSYISKRKREQLANRIGGLMLEVFNNAKLGAVSAFSWPPYHLISNVKANFKFNEPHVNYCPADEELSYITPAQHADLMSYIVKTDKPNLRSKLENSLAVSLSVDGSVDRFQLDNKHVTCKIVTDDGKQENLFLGFDEAPERRTTGYVAAVKSAVEWVIPWDSLFPIVTSIVTDGANENTGASVGKT